MDGVHHWPMGWRMLREQAQTNAARPVGACSGGWSEFQFAEHRMPTLEEINAAAPETPVFILHLYCRALLNQAALRACGYTKDTPNPPAEKSSATARVIPGFAHRTTQCNDSLRHSRQRAKLPPDISRTRRVISCVNSTGSD